MYKDLIVIVLLIVNTVLGVMPLLNSNDIAKKEEDEGIKKEVIANNPPPKYQLEEVTEF